MKKCLSEIHQFESPDPVHTWNIYLCQQVQEQRARVLALLEEKEEENQKIQEENQKAKMEREKILELLENVMISLKSVHCKNTVTQSSFCSKL